MERGEMSVSRMYPDEALAIARLRQWAYDRLQVASARTVEYKRSGWTQRRSRDFDARLVRVMDFSRCMARLDAEDQIMLVLAYRDKENHQRIAEALHISLRTLDTRLPLARRRLANELDRVCLL
jgi:DNA-directed RNA polymerase specialized sigma24 family protein